MNPDTKGLVQMQQLPGESIAHHAKDPHNLDNLTHSKTIYHLLLGSTEKDTQYTNISQESLFQALISGGRDTTSNATMQAVFHLAQYPDILEKLKEFDKAWPTWKPSQRWKSCPTWAASCF